MKKKKKKRDTKIFNPTLAQREKFASDYIGHPGPASTLAAHRRRADSIMGFDEFARTVARMSKKKRK